MDVRYARRLSEELLEAFEAVRKIEENSLNAAHGSSISPSESNLIEAVARGGERGVTISQIAAELSITLASVTVGVNKLVHKGFLVKEKGAEDGRMVFVKLTREGQFVLMEGRDARSARDTVISSPTSCAASVWSLPTRSWRFSSTRWRSSTASSAETIIFTEKSCSPRENSGRRAERRQEK